MRFHSLPKGILSAVIIAVVLLLAGLIVGSFKYAETLWAPGDLSRFHADSTVCGDCHQPFKGTTTDKCAACHDLKYFARRSRPTVAEFHQQQIREGKACTGCHTEHRGALAQITIGALVNPHGEFVFRATGTHSCNACHDFTGDVNSRSKLLDNAIVNRLKEEGDGAHRTGEIAHCLNCHKGGRLEIEGDEEDE